MAIRPDSHRDSCGSQTGHAWKLAVVTDNANRLITQVKGEVGNISGDAQRLLLTLNSVTSDERPKIDRIADQLLSLTQHADTLMATIGPVIGHADDTIQNVNGTISGLREPIRTDLTELQTTLQQAKNLLADIRGVVRTNDFKIDDTVENLRVATDNLGQLTDQLKQRPWSLIRTKQRKDRKLPD